MGRAIAKPIKAMALNDGFRSISLSLITLYPSYKFYVYPSYELKHWRQIESKIRNRVASFEQAAAEEKLKSIHNSH